MDVVVRSTYRIISIPPRVLSSTVAFLPQLFSPCLSLCPLQSHQAFCPLSALLSVIVRSFSTVMSEFLWISVVAMHVVNLISRHFHCKVRL